MADQNQLDILNQGVEVWNQWRESHPDIEPDLSGVSLFNANLGSTNLSSANLGSANLGSALQLHFFGGSVLSSQLGI